MVHLKNVSISVFESLERGSKRKKKKKSMVFNELSEASTYVIANALKCSYLSMTRCPNQYYSRSLLSK